MSVPASGWRMHGTWIFASWSGFLLLRKTRSTRSPATFTSARNGNYSATVLEPFDMVGAVIPFN